MIENILYEIDNAFNESEDNVLTAIQESCTKALEILENSSDDIDVSGFGVFQEAAEATAKKEPETKENNITRHVNMKKAKTEENLSKLAVTGKRQFEKQIEVIKALEHLLKSEYIKLWANIIDNTPQFLKDLVSALKEVMSSGKSDTKGVVSEAFLYDEKKDLYKRAQSNERAIDYVYTILTAKSYKVNSPRMKFIAETCIAKYYTNENGDIDEAGVNELISRLTSDIAELEKFKEQCTNKHDIKEADKIIRSYTDFSSRLMQQIKKDESLENDSKMAKIQKGYNNLLTNYQYHTNHYESSTMFDDAHDKLNEKGIVGKIDAAFTGVKGLLKWGWETAAFLGNIGKNIVKNAGRIDYPTWVDISKHAIGIVRAMVGIFKWAIKIAGYAIGLTAATGFSLITLPMLFMLLIKSGAKSATKLGGRIAVQQVSEKFNMEMSKYRDAIRQDVVAIINRSGIKMETFDHQITMSAGGKK